MNDVDYKSEELKKEIFDLSDQMKSLSAEIDKIKVQREEKVRELMHVWDKN